MCSVYIFRRKTRNKINAIKILTLQFIVTRKGKEKYLHRKYISSPLRMSYYNKLKGSHIKRDSSASEFIIERSSRRVSLVLRRDISSKRRGVNGFRFTRRLMARSISRRRGRVQRSRRVVANWNARSIVRILVRDQVYTSRETRGIFNDTQYRRTCIRNVSSFEDTKTRNTVISQFKGRNRSIWVSFRLHLRDTPMSLGPFDMLWIPLPSSVIEQKRLAKDYGPFCSICSPL